MAAVARNKARSQEMLTARQPVLQSAFSKMPRIGSTDPGRLKQTVVVGANENGGIWRSSRLVDGRRVLYGVLSCDLPMGAPLRHVPKL